MRRPSFEFDERSAVSVETLRKQGFEFKNIIVGDKVIMLPLNFGFQCVQPQRNPNLKEEK